MKAMEKKFKKLEKQITKEPRPEGAVAAVEPSLEFAFNAIHRPNQHKTELNRVNPVGLLVETILQCFSLLFSMMSTLFTGGSKILNSFQSSSSPSRARNSLKKHNRRQKAIKTHYLQRKSYFHGRHLPSPSNNGTKYGTSKPDSKYPVQSDASNGTKITKTATQQAKISSPCKGDAFRGHSLNEEIPHYAFSAKEHPRTPSTYTWSYVLLLFVTHLLLDVFFKDMHCVCKTLLTVFILLSSQTIYRWQTMKDYAFTATFSTTKMLTILDSGSTSHLFSSPSDFIPSSLSKEVTEIQVAGGKSIFSTHRGTIRLVSTTPNGSVKKILLRNALLVPELTHNLVSLRRLDDANCTTTINDGQMVIHAYDNEIIMYAPLNTGLYCPQVVVENLPPSSDDSDMPDVYKYKHNVQNVVFNPLSFPFLNVSVPKNILKISKPESCNHDQDSDLPNLCDSDDEDRQ